jgi:hypothetical protein
MSFRPKKSAAANVESDKIPVSPYRNLSVQDGKNLCGPGRPLKTNSGVQAELTWPSFSKMRPKPTLDAGLVFFVLGGPRWARVGPVVGFCLL